MSEIRAVIFDVFGSLCQITSPQRPYQRLARRVSDPVQFTKAVMTQPLDLRQSARRAMAQVSEQELCRLESDLDAELASIRLFPDVCRVLATLRERGYRLGVLSNLAAPYAAPLRALLPPDLDLYGWSFERGHAKPHPRLYHWACQVLGMPADEVLMVGATRVPDYSGAQACGLQACWLRRQATTVVDADTISNLDEVLLRLPELSAA
ncbi:HAD family hydrolase [Pseudaeromonas sharmana]|uniref:HAD family hydrolase n=1 Tax=Pseudaeromonas sharmana TaxID=328412 RepID=A0ABV8CRY6_9GAMM